MQSICIVIYTHVTSFGLVKLLLMSVLKHTVNHTAALPHIKQCLPMLVPHLLQIVNLSVSLWASRLNRIK